MADEILLDGTTYISSKRASSVTEYTQDYIGQLARGGHIDARRVGGLWYVDLHSLNAYKTNAQDHKPEPPVRTDQGHAPDTVVSFDGKDYISAGRAAKITGYHQDYVGQLARSGKINSRQISNRWFVDRAAIQAHKEEKDTLLAKVQLDSVGLKRNPAHEALLRGAETFFTYSSHSREDLAELVGLKRTSPGDDFVDATVHNIQRGEIWETPGDEDSIPEPQVPQKYEEVDLRRRKKGLASKLVWPAVFSLVVVGGIGLFFFKVPSVVVRLSQSASSVGAVSVLRAFAEKVEGLIAHEQSYTRSD